MGGALDAVIDGETGLLVDPTHHVVAADSIVALLTDRELAAKLGTAGQRRAEAQTWQRMVGEVDDLIEVPVSERRQRR